MEDSQQHMMMSAQSQGASRLSVFAFSVSKETLGDMQRNFRRQHQSPRYRLLRILPGPGQSHHSRLQSPED